MLLLSERKASVLSANPSSCGIGCLVVSASREEEDRRALTDEEEEEAVKKKRKMVSGLINANPVVHERKERSSRPVATNSEDSSDIDHFDSLEIFDILLCVIFLLHLPFSDRFLLALSVSSFSSSSCSVF